jgi:hypothetical protein
LREAYAARSLLLVFCCNVHLRACLKDLRCAVADGKLVCETFTQFGFGVFCAHFDEAVTKVGSRIVVINEFEKSNLALVQSSDGIMWNGFSKLHFQDRDSHRSSFITTLLVIASSFFSRTNDSTWIHGSVLMQYGHAQGAVSTHRERYRVTSHLSRPGQETVEHEFGRNGRNAMYCNAM